MQDLIELTPQLLLEQSQEMTSLCSAYENLFANVSSDLNGINDSWSDLLSNNFSVKIGSAQKLFSGALTMLRNSAESLRMVAESYEETDAGWASKISGSLNTIFAQSTATVADPSTAPQTTMVDMENYCAKVTHAEYAKLCQLWQTSDEACDESTNRTLAGTFAALLQNNLPANDPLRNITEDQIRVIRSPSGFSAAIIGSGNQALVIFAGTDITKYNDIMSDIGLVEGLEGPQEMEAKALVESLSREYSDVVVTGYSLGGYLATAAALDNDRVSECIAFDPPGRKDKLLQQMFNGDQVSKITTYKAVGSPISSYIAGNRGIGKVIPVFVSLKDNALCHGIRQISESLDKDGKIHRTWNQWSLENGEGGV